MLISELMSTPETARAITASQIFLVNTLLGLSRQKGYIWATDKALSKIVDRPIRSIQRWLKKLDDEGFIRRETERVRFGKAKQKIKWRVTRKIYLLRSPFNENPQNLSNILNFASFQENNKKASLNPAPFQENNKKASLNPEPFQERSKKASLNPESFQENNKKASLNPAPSSNSPRESESEEVSGGGGIRIENIYNKTTTENTCRQPQDSQGSAKSPSSNSPRENEVEKVSGGGGIRIENIYNKTTTENTCRQPQDRENVVVSFSNKNFSNENEEFIYPDLHKLNLAHSLKVKLSKKYSKEDIRIAVIRTLDWTTRLCDTKAILTVLNRMKTWVDNIPKEKIEENNKIKLKNLQHLDGIYIANTSIVVGYNYIEFISGPTCKVFYAKDREFESKFAEEYRRLKELEKLYNMNTQIKRAS